MSNQRRALVIDDDASIVEVLETMLQLRGFAVDVVTDGIHALEPAHDYDVVLLDMKMPVFDGERLVDYWLLTRPELLQRVILLTGFAKYSQERTLPIFATLVKPFEVGLLGELIDQCILPTPRLS